ncbi:M15 family metallopeptidase [Aminipila butyrica]|uniref:M15 family metallopeptidase n=1 Tax=Aminipila butyrica TaxID=433296 RepID=A0A858BWD4_9FIRM|nr:M15 family metallopeptidase [Aminipila butyrica]QIB70391.1 M15 family metallopeptidase [Aminipila butyrica]
MKRQKRIIYLSVALVALLLLGGYAVGHLKEGSFFGLGGEGSKQANDSPKGSENGKPPVVVESSESVKRRAALKKDLEQGLFLLVNKENSVSRDYKPEDLTAVKYFAPDRPEQGRYLRAKAADAFHELSEAAAAEGYEIIVTTAYRSYGFQETLYSNYVKTHGQAEADTFSAQPGKSEHQTGLAADVSSPSVQYQLTRDYIDTPEGKWLNDNAYKFGFIIRFPKGKEDITGYVYEPWHIRYVGKTAAKEIFDEGLTLEEYVEKEI